MKKVLLSLLVISMAVALVACSAPAPAASSAPAESSAAQGGSDSSGGGAAAPADGKHITLITMDQMDVHWVKMEKAAKAEVEKLNADGAGIVYEWLAPEKKDNAQQIQQIETAINNGANAIIISVNDSTACNDALQQAIDKGIKLIYVDATSSLKSDATFSTDNFAAGKMAGDEMKARLKAANITSGKIGIVSAQAGVQSCIDRVDGFISAFDGDTSFDVLKDNVQYSDGDASKGQELANALINDGVVALYAANDGATTGTANAVKEANANGKNIVCVGFDNSSSNRGLVRDGALLAFMAQNPQAMGSKAIIAANDLLDGKALTETDVDTGVTVVSTDNVDQFED